MAHLTASSKLVVCVRANGGCLRGKKMKRMGPLTTTIQTHQGSSPYPYGDISYPCGESTKSFGEDYLTLCKPLY